MTRAPTGSATAAAQPRWPASIASARVLLMVAARRPAVWVAGLGLTACLIGVAVPGVAAGVAVGFAVAAGGLCAIGSAGRACTAGAIAASAVVPLVGVAIVGTAARCPVIAAAAAIGLVGAMALLAALRSRGAGAADAASVTIAATSAAGAAAAAARAVGDEAAALAAAAAAACVPAVVVLRAESLLERLVEPVAWTPSRVRLPQPGPTRLRHVLLQAAMLSSLAAMVGGLFLQPAGAPWVGALGAAWLIALTLPISCLGDEASPATAWRRLLAGVPGPRAVAGSAGRRWFDVARSGSPVARCVIWHLAVLAWPACVALVLSAGEAERRRAALVVLATLGAAAAAVLLVARVGGHERRDTPAPSGETALAAGLGMTLLALLGVVTAG